ncbi:MAG: hypothetical protein A3I44_02065 [Candidatus Sungbacteria bacterium RIFCSPLOWO2_02_FULL_51_17]|uniref:ABC transporter domain-containing protein n=1 Tax=Candidatus Sungbacteria bacterium RIFCSPHIGHO2_02_FULL_51_29 TaxID=1802273 RepID=A0A1G2KXI3_9BACT|nr:MAG: hypothetical protein A2676_04290 [Candidatus Sungbacteria bacterium RIFCSPHIGHO2_01_FULL_51_22]OHA03151.1 MAG: hypothetical protein A3C16_01755 [Candidatus Sungbacteria bacterium RIFCSPHIGHO2_02_FULL_51_29]OHA04797.1 MAG: hypothetical protein A3B29_03315 [Candidatus Sungbacteria bacterium RIFCSPLOWO2_01_FULL_51_34]OHA11066.1 MAG: hypothetical protein A3I44_02065 [Candidatus Sungbacteria bacterium RIFCSPLOWO2_02_FULL_51_17]
MIDPEEERAVPRSWGDYVKEMKEAGRVYWWLWRELATADGKKRLRQVMVTLFLMTVLHSIQPWLVTFIYDGLVAHTAGRIILGLAGYLAISAVFTRFVDYYHGVSREWFLGINWRRLNERIAELFFEKSMGQHVQESSRLSVSNIDKGRWRVLDIQAMIFFEGSNTLLSILVSFACLWVISPVAGAIMTSVIICYIIWMFFLNQRVMEVCLPIDKESRALNRYTYERLEKIERVKVSDRCAEELAYMNERFDDVMARDRGFWIWFIKMATIRGVMNSVGLVAIMAYGAWLVWSGQWSIGLLYPLYSWSNQVSENIWRIGHIEHQLNWNMPAVKSLIDALSIAPDVKDAPNAITLRAEDGVHIVFDNVSHAYPKGGKEEGADGGDPASSVLRRVHFEIAPGEKVALIGASGAGKTTVMRLLLRFMDPDKGRIIINGTDLRAIKLGSWMRTLGYIPQQAQILDGTVRYNLTYALSPEERAAIGDNELWEVMRSLKIDFGPRLAQGLETRVGRNGIKLSGGEAQRLMIGAAAIKKPPFMLIDEATSSLDSTTERAVQAGLEKVLAGGTGALVIAHRLSTVRDLCTKFVVLRPVTEMNGDHSQVEAIGGSFEELFEDSPTFRRLARDQGIVLS